MPKDHIDRDQKLVCVPSSTKRLIEVLAKYEDRTQMATVVRAVREYANNQIKSSPKLKQLLPKGGDV
jgi:hypothetical protein